MPRRTKPSRPYSKDARELVENVYAFCKKEKKEGLNIPLDRALERTAELTGVSVSSVKRFTTQTEATFKPHLQRQEKMHVDDFDEGVVRRTINAMYVQHRILPTLGNIRHALEENVGFTGSKSFLRKKLRSIGFNYRRCSINRKVLMERPDVVMHRIQFLRQIHQLREAGHPIVYTDETFVHSTHTVPKCWQDDNIGLKVPFSKGERMIVVHAGCSEGFIPGAGLVFKAKSATGDYHNEMNNSNFMKWLQELLIPNLPPKSVLVLDNAAYHNVQVDRCPTTATRKAEIQEWLTRNNIGYAPHMLKAELLNICKQHKQHPRYVVDEVLARHGHQTIRLPPYHADLNPLELIWGNLKGFIARRNLTFKLATVKDLIHEGMQSITDDVWAKCVAHVKLTERRYWDIDIAVDNCVDPLVINLASNSETDGSSTDTASEGGD